MFPKVNKKNSGKQPEIEAKSEVDAESDRGSIQAVGNEGMNNLLNTSFDPGMLRIPDEDNEIELDGPEVFGGGRKSSGSGSDDQNNDLLNSGSNLNNNNINNNNNANRNKIDKAHKKEEEINRADDPAEVIEKAPDDVIDELMDEVEEENPDLDLSMIAERPKRKKGKGGKGGNQANRRADIRNVSDDMKPAEGFNFHAIKLPKRKRSGTGDRFLSGLAWYSGKTIGRLLSAIGNALYWGLGYLPHKLYNKIKGKKTKERISPSEFQKTRQHDQVPGWNGKKFQKQIQGERVANDPIEVDFRKIPGVWAQMTAGQAEDENGDPLDPIITVYVAEPKEQSDDTTAHRDIGHTFIGLEFSHFSKVTNHFERYITRYGLFAPGANNASSYIAGYYQNATIPAQLLNDKNYSYDISRSFPAKPEQVNDIMKASETYADRGYRLFDRNCTTFVKEMVVDIAHIREAEHILNPEEILMDHTLNAGMFASIMLSPNSSLGMKHIFGEMAAQDDMSYERIGNKRVTKEEYDRFKET